MEANSPQVAPDAEQVDGTPQSKRDSTAGPTEPPGAIPA